MIVRIITVQVKPESVAAFEAETVKNHEGSLKEPGVLRFDVLRDTEQDGTFVLYEVYRDQAAVDAHKETAHYANWKNAVADMMASPRESTAYDVIAPVDPNLW